MSDLISRKALLEVVYNNVVPDKEGNWTFTKPIIDAITNAPAIEQGELVKKAVAYALEEAAKICDDNLMSWADNEWHAASKDCAKRIRALIKHNAKEGE